MGSNIPEIPKRGKSKKHKGKSPVGQAKKGGTSTKGVGKNSKDYT